MQSTACVDKIMGAFQNVSCFVVEHKYSILKRRQCVFLTQSKIQSGIGFIVDALFDYFVYLHSLYTVVKLHTNIVLIHFGRQPI